MPETPWAKEVVGVAATAGQLNGRRDLAVGPEYGPAPIAAAGARRRHRVISSPAGRKPLTDFDFVLLTVPAVR